MGSSGSSYCCQGCAWGQGFPPPGMTGVCCLGGYKMPSGSLSGGPISQLRRLGPRCECGQSVVGSLHPPRLPVLPSSFQDSLRTSPAPCPARPPSSEHHWPHLWLVLGLQLYISHLGTSLSVPPAPESPQQCCPSHWRISQHPLSFWLQKEKLSAQASLKRHTSLNDLSLTRDEQEIEFLRLQVLEQQHVIDDLSLVRCRSRPGSRGGVKMEHQDRSGP